MLAPLGADELALPRPAAAAARRAGAALSARSPEPPSLMPSGVIFEFPVKDLPAPPARQRP